MVAATARSGPAPSGSTYSAARASFDSGSFVMASVNEPSRRPASSTATMSGERPDWLTPTTSAPASEGPAQYTV